MKLIDLNAFLNFIPVFTPIHKTMYDTEKNPPEKTQLSWFALFSKRTVYMLMSYIWLSLIHI